MDLLQLMKNRRSIRKYTDEKIPKEKLDMILKAGLLAPSSKNIRPVEFIVVENRDMLNKLAKSKTAGAGMLSDAACAIVVIADTSKADAWIEDCSLAMGNMLLMAEDLGIASCWVQSRLRKILLGKSSGEYVKDVLGIPSQYEVEAILSLGIAKRAEPPRDWEETEQHKIHKERF
ncbi:MAG: nitroreductase family protein [Faecalibacterium sp.]|nr:nitroreductase family protein [Ruminococcus sp.]MCM1486074.1 nitroreductase family protein [Faecalibacterium sp.]